LSIYDDPFGLTGNNSRRDKKRAFTQTQKKEILYAQNNKCAICHKSLDPRDIEYDHKTPWADKGHTKVKNGRAVCGSCHNIKTHKDKLKKVEGKKSNKKTSVNPFEVKIPVLKMPKSKGGFGLF
jgi:nitrate/TMAO reductase-like tetraheme cytochrome c subunit